MVNALNTYTLPPLLGTKPGPNLKAKGLRIAVIYIYIYVNYHGRQFWPPAKSLLKHHL